MEDNENVVVETTENVEEQATETLVDGAKATTEEEKLYSQADLDRLVNEKVDEILPRKLERAKSKLTKEYENKYSRVETVLNAGLGTSNLDEATNKLADFYKEKGITIPEQPKFSEHQLNVLANAEASDIINNSDYKEIEEEANRLADLYESNNISDMDKLVFQRLGDYLTSENSKRELAEIGVKPEALKDSEYIEFADKLNPSLSAKEKYEMYMKFKPKPKVEPMGSMKTTTTKQVKDYYTPEEARRLTSKDLDNPQVMEAVEKSMQMWYNK